MTASNAVQHRRVATSNTHRFLKNRAEINQMEARQLGGLIPIGHGGTSGTGSGDDDDDAGPSLPHGPHLPFPPTIDGPVFTRPSSTSSSTTPLPTDSSTSSDKSTSSTESSTSSTESSTSSSTTESPTPTPTPEPTPESGGGHAHATEYQTVTANMPADTGTSEVGNTGASHAGPIVGGILGAAVGIAVIVFIFRCLTRRRQKNNNPLTFDPQQFRRSGVMLHDPPTAQGAINERGMTPRPPSIIEKKLAAPTPAPAYHSQANASFPSPFVPYGSSQVQFGQVRPEYTGQYSYSAHPQQHYPNFQVANPTPLTPAFGANRYGARSFSPLPSPTSTMAPVYDSQLGEKYISGATVARQGSATPASYPTITRQSSTTSQNQPGPTPAQYTDLSRVSSAPATRTAMIDEEAIDPTRSSVTPFQAVQYAEISKRLNTEPPAGLSTPAAEELMETMMARSQANGNPAISNDDDDDLPPVPRLSDDGRATESPFADPSPIASRHASIVELEPPPPIHRPRIDSNPPMLPELAIPRVSVNSGYDFPESLFENTPNATPMGRAFPSGVSGALGAGNLGTPTTTMGKFPLTPSPLTSSFSVPSPPVERATFASSATGRVVEIAARTPTTPATPYISPNSPTTSPTAATTPASKRPDTVYDPADAYGGI